MEPIMTYGWVCPVCGKVNAPWASQCTCKGKLPVPCEPTCNTGAPSFSHLLSDFVTPKEYQKAIEDSLNINSTHDPWVIDSSGKIHKTNYESPDSTTNN